MFVLFIARQEEKTNNRRIYATRQKASMYGRAEKKFHKHLLAETKDFFFIEKMCGDHSSHIYCCCNEASTLTSLSFLNGIQTISPPAPLDGVERKRP